MDSLPTNANRSGPNGSFLYSAADVTAPRTALLRYGSKGQMGSSGSIKVRSPLSLALLARADALPSLSLASLECIVEWSKGFPNRVGSWETTARFAWRSEGSPVLAPLLLFVV